MQIMPTRLHEGPRRASLVQPDAKVCVHVHERRLVERLVEHRLHQCAEHLERVHREVQQLVRQLVELLAVESKTSTTTMKMGDRDRKC